VTPARATAAAALCAALVLLCDATASAHGRSRSFSSWQLEASGAQASARMDALELTRLGLDVTRAPDDAQRAARYLAEHLVLSDERGTCAVTEVRLRSAPEGWLAAAWRAECEGPPRFLESRLLEREVQGHLHLARIAHPDGSVTERALAGAERRSALATDPEGAVPDVLGFTRLGIAHILSGWDHLAFVFALLILGGTLRQVATLITGFTLAHSLTLGLAVVGWVRPDPAGVEAAIAFSVLLIAAENAWLLGGRQGRLPRAVTALPLAAAAAVWLGLGRGSVLAWAGLGLFTACHFALLARSRGPGLRVALTFGFGLIHGLGFAGALAELDLPTERLVPALFGFNAGVEIGQLGVVALVWPGLRALALRQPVLHARAAALGSAAIAGLGGYWLLQRSLG